MNLNELRDKVYQCAVAHGWHEKDLSDEHFLCLVISELMEAVDADRKRKYANVELYKAECDYYSHGYEDFAELIFEECIKDSVEDELADACIRLLDLAGLRKCELSLSDSLHFREVSFTEFSYLLCAFITNPDKGHKDWLKHHISYSLGFIFMWCQRKGIDIFWHIEQKMKYNELRPYKHGNKKY